MKSVAEHNKEIRYKAEYRANEMKAFPSPLEERMQVFLDKHFISYEFQKVFYIYGKGRKIVNYYIADFYIPYRNLIIEVDGKFHEKHKQHDKMRTKTIQEHYPDVEVLRYTWADLSDENIMKKLLYKIK